MSVLRIRFARSSERVNDDDEKEDKGSLLHFIEHREEQLKRTAEDQMRGILLGLSNKNNNSYFYKILISVKKNIKVYDIHEINVPLERMKDGKSLNH